MRLALQVSIATVALLAALLFVGVKLGLASEACAGQMVRASFYGKESGHRTASGLAFDGTQWLVAHRSFPFGTKLRLTYRGRSVVAPVEDRGPFIAGRTLDLSRAVAVSLGTIPAGVATVCMEQLS